MKATKKLMALFLALAMALSLCVCVNADDLTSLPTTAQTSNGSVSKENAPASTVYKLVLPTAQDKLFDFILDPDNLIRNTHAAAYSGATFNDTAGHLFFKNADAVAAEGTTPATPAIYSGSSNSVTVTNKSNVPVNVTLTTSLTDLANVDFSATDDLSAAEGPAIYLAMESECVTTANNNPAWDYTLPEVTYVNDDYIGIIDSVTFAWDATNITGVLEDDDSTAEDIEDVNALKDAFNAALAEGLKIEIAYTHGTDGATMTATPTSPTLEGYTFEFDATSYLLDSTNDDKALVATLTVTADPPEGETVGTDIGAFTFNFKNDLTATTQYLEDATVSVSVAAGSAVMEETTPVQAEEDGAIKAEVTRLLPGVPNAYKLTYNATDKVYEYTEQGSSNVYKSISFNLTGKINDDAGWKNLGTPTIAVTWNMTAAGVVEEEDGGNNGAQVTPPALSVTAGVTGATTNGKWTINVNDSGMTKVLSVDIGTGTAVKTLTVSSPFGNTAGYAKYTYEDDTKTITVGVKGNSTTSPQASFGTTVVVLANDDESVKYTCTFDAKTTGTEATFELVA